MSLPGFTADMVFKGSNQPLARVRSLSELTTTLGVEAQFNGEGPTLIPPGIPLEPRGDWTGPSSDPFNPEMPPDEVWWRWFRYFWRDAPGTDPPSPPGFFGWPGWGPIGWTAGATLVGIGLGTLLGYEIEKHEIFANPAPKPGIPTASCVPVPPNTQHSITANSHLGCARSESLARQAAEDDCKTRTNRCTGSCPGTAPCAPYAKVWNTVTVLAGGFFEALASGCSTTAYYTCECGCPPPPLPAPGTAPGYGSGVAPVPGPGQPLGGPAHPFGR